MSDFRIKADWVPSDEQDILMRETAAALQIDVNGYLLTKNTNIWTKSVQDKVIVSTYPLAQWFAYHWWRLENELEPDGEPNFDWRFAHELGAANHGFVWPRVVFASDGTLMNISFGSFREQKQMQDQSVEYIYQSEKTQTVTLLDFQNAVKGLIEKSIEQLSIDSDLKDLWNIVCEDIQSPNNSAIRKIEGMLGFDPEECPSKLLNQFINYQRRIGVDSMKELAPFFKSGQMQSYLVFDKSISAKLQIAPEEISFDSSKDVLPWQQGKKAAKQLRERCDFTQDCISNKNLRDLLNISEKDFNSYEEENGKSLISIGKRNNNNTFQIVPRMHKRSTGRRFELARLICDALLTSKEQDKEWLVASDYGSFRQKRQRSFAAEFLCPINSLLEFLNKDFSDSMLEAAAEHFDVSEWTVRTTLVNNNVVSRNKVLPCPV